MSNLLFVLRSINYSTNLWLSFTKDWRNWMLLFFNLLSSKTVFLRSKEQALDRYVNSCVGGCHYLIILCSWTIHFPHLCSSCDVTKDRNILSVAWFWDLMPRKIIIANTMFSAALPQLMVHVSGAWLRYLIWWRVTWVTTKGAKLLFRHPSTYVHSQLF